MRLIAAFMLLCVSAVGCGNDSPTTPSGSFSGTWTGTSNSLVGRLNMSLSLTQSGSSISGSYSCTSVACAFSSGSISGSASGDSLSGAVSFAGGAARCGTFSGTRSGNTLSGTYSCSWGDSGTWSATRQ